MSSLGNPLICSCSLDYSLSPFTQNFLPGHDHRPYAPESGLLHWLHIVISNAKAFILGTYHGLPKQYLQAYLDEYCFRFSRRDFGPRLMERLALAVSSSVRLS